MKINFVKSTSFSDEAVVALVNGKNLPSIIGESDRALAEKYASLRESFKGKNKDMFSFGMLPSVKGAMPFFAASAGDSKNITEQSLKALGGRIAASMNMLKIKKVVVLAEDLKSDDMDISAMVCHVATGIKLRNYKFDKYFIKKKSEHALPLEEVTFHVSDPEGAAAAFSDMEKIIECVHTCRGFSSEPPNVLYPESFAARVEEYRSLGVVVEVLHEKELKEHKMGAILGVGQGSENRPCMAVLRWNGADDENDQPLALVGKGVTFDTGGINLKPTVGMKGMKYDMTGAAVVASTIRSLAMRKAKVNVVGVMCLAENAISGTAQRPEDIVTSMSGQTIEIGNTDAEGRLILADGMWYVQEKYNPRLMIDLATLTGAIIIALGDEHAGLFSNNEELSKQLLDAGIATGEKLWRLPMNDAYDRIMDSSIADMNNCGNRKAGSITAAQFLQRFVKGDLPWAHLDIAGVDNKDAASDLHPKGATGFGVMLLNRFIKDNFEEKN